MIRNFVRPPSSPSEYIADAVRLIGVLSVISAAIWWTPTDVGILALAVPASIVPRFVAARGGFDIVYGVVILTAAWSNVLGLYETIPGWDIALHFVCTGVIASMTYLVLAEFRVVPSRANRGFSRRTAIVTTATAGLAVSALWEMVEWFGHTFISKEIYVAYDDTIGDMAAGGVGALIAGIVVAAVRLVRPTPAEHQEDLIARRRPLH